MKTHLRAGLWIVTIAVGALAGPLPREYVAADAKWLLHLDIQNLLTTQVGDFLAREVLDRKFEKPTADLKSQINFDFSWRRITGVTAYGTDFQAAERAKGVLLLTTDLDVAQALEAVTEKLNAASPGGAGPVERVEAGATPVYAFNEDVYVAVVPGKPVVVGKSKRMVMRARDVLTGAAANLNGVAGFADYPPPPANFFFFSAAEGFNEAAPIPPQANVLKMADSLRLIAGESGDQVCLNLALKAKSAEVSQQIQQVIQGMIALVALSQTENQDLRQLAQSVKVAVADRLVTVDVLFPVGKTIEKIQENERKRAGH